MITVAEQLNFTTLALNELSKEPKMYSTVATFIQIAEECSRIYNNKLH